MTTDSGMDTRSRTQLAPRGRFPRPHLRLDLAAQPGHLPARWSGAPGIVVILQLQMLLPAFSAIVLGLFFFPESPDLPRPGPSSAGRGRWFYYYFLLLTVIYALGALGVWLAPAQQTHHAGGRHHPPASGLSGSARARRAPLRRGPRGDGPGLAGLGQLALLAALWPGLRRLLRPASGAQRQLRPGRGPIWRRLPTPPGLSPGYLPDPGRGAVGAAGADPGHRHRLWRGVRLAGISAERAVQDGPGARRAPAGRDLGSLALAADPHGLTTIRAIRCSACC